MHDWRIAAILPMLAAASGCANTFGGVDVHHVSPGMVAISQPATVRSAYTNGTMVCPEPPPDAALQAVAQAAAKIGTQAGLSVDVSGGLTTSVVALAGRTQVVLIARDAFTANCILRMNGFIDPATAERNFQDTLGVITTIARTDQIQAGADSVKANTEATKVALKAAASTDPAVKALVAQMTHVVTTDADIVVAALTGATGSFDPGASAKFFAQKSVRDVISPDVADTLSKVKNAENLRSLLMGSYVDYSHDLAELAKDFKG